MEHISFHLRVLPVGSIPFVLAYKYLSRSVIRINNYIIGQPVDKTHLALIKIILLKYQSDNNVFYLVLKSLINNEYPLYKYALIQ